MFPSNETLEHLRLNPDEQRDLYRSPAYNSRYKSQHTLEAFKEKHGDWEERGREYQEWLGKRSESGNF